MACTHVKNCELFAQFALNPALKVWQIHFCEGDYARCARYQLSLEGKSVPLNLLPNGKKVEAPRSSTAYGAAAMLNAILKNRVHMVESLLKTGADPNARNPDGTTPLMAAASTGNLEIVQMLLARGASTSLANGAGETAAEIAERYGFPELAAFLEHGGKGPLPVQRESARRVSAAVSIPSADSPPPLAPVAATRPAATPAARHAHPYYLRIEASSSVSAMTDQVAHICKALNIGIDIITQAAQGESSTPIIVLTQPLNDQATIVSAVQHIEALNPIVSKVTCMRMESVPAQAARRVV